MYIWRKNLKQCTSTNIEDFLGTLSCNGNIFNWLPTERPRKTLGEQPGQPYRIQDNVPFYIESDHDPQSGV